MTVHADYYCTYTFETDEQKLRLVINERMRTTTAMTNERTKLKDKSIHGPARRREKLIIMKFVHFEISAKINVYEC